MESHSKVDMVKTQTWDPRACVVTIKPLCYPNTFLLLPELSELIMGSNQGHTQGAYAPGDALEGAPLDVWMENISLGN